MPIPNFAWRCQRPWRFWEVWLAIVVAAILVSVLTAKVSYSGSWDGDPSFRNRLAMEAVNRFVSEWVNDGDPIVAFIQAYHRYPTMAHEVMLAVFVVCINGLNIVDFDTVVLLAAWFATMWTLIGAFVVYLVLRMFVPRWLALLVLPMCMLGGYILLYANFPRQNMPSHVLGWIAFALYLRARPRNFEMKTRDACMVGFCWGLSVPTHYSSSYLSIAFITAELVLAVVQKSGRRPLIINLTKIFLTAGLVWLVVDLYFCAMWWIFPDEILVNGESPSSFTVGMLFTSWRLLSEAAAHKLTDDVWWFLPGFLYRNFGVIGSLLLLIGAVGMVWTVARGVSRPVTRESHLRIAIVMTIVAVSIVVSLGYFQNARKLMVFYPAWCVAMLFGVQICSAALRALAGRRGALAAHPKERDRSIESILSESSLRPKPMSVAVVALLLGCHAVSFWPTGRDIFHYRRDSGYMREYIATHSLDRVLLYTKRPESVMTFAATQAVFDSVSADAMADYDWVMIYRLYHGESGSAMDRLQGLIPIASFKNQNALPIHWYEFPLKESFADFSNPLTHSRGLYRLADVREALLSGD